MANVKIWGQWELEPTRKTFNPRKKCRDCPFLFDFWCNYYQSRVPEDLFNQDCMVIDIIVEEL